MDCGGTENMLMHLFRATPRQDIAMDFLVNCHGPVQGYFDEEILQAGARILHIQSQGRLGPLRYVQTLVRLLRQGGPYDVVHSHLDWQGGLIALAARWAEVPRVIVHSHTTRVMGRGLRYQVALVLQKALIRAFATDLWGCSEVACRHLFGPDRPWCVIPNGIPLDRYLDVSAEARQALRQAWGCGPDSLVLGHAGSFSENKNQLFLVELMQGLSSQGQEVHLVLAGDPSTPYGAKVRTRVLELGLQDRVHFLGLRRDLPEILSALDVFLLPSAFEGLGIVALEAQAVGCPCMVSEGIPTEVDLGLGLVARVSTASSDSWARCVLERSSLLRPTREQVATAFQSKGFDIKTSSAEVAQQYREGWQA
ncbi:MAG: glycosyltransferase [Holophagaceae bacterium]|nr:glycosyltransferase [Holophagaceae bacterium]